MVQFETSVENDKFENFNSRLDSLVSDSVDD
jgi:hypothetical protein